ncbi:MAG: hypothetical protein WBO55_09910 [Rhizobiaceae bacterium]
MKIARFVNLFIGILILFVSVLSIASLSQITSQVEAKTDGENDVFLPIITNPINPGEMVNAPDGEFQGL